MTRSTLASALALALVCAGHTAWANQPEDGAADAGDTAADTGAADPGAADPGATDTAADGGDAAADGGDAAAADASASSAAPAASSGALSGYKKGFFIKSADGKFSVTIQNRVQGRYTFEEPDGDDNRETNFSISRARLTLKGHAYSKNIKYKFQTDYGKGNVVLKDFLVDYKPGSGDIRVRLGQWKRPFSRQQINSSGRLELVDRAITDKAFGGGRDIGIAVHNNYEKSPDLEWAVGVFNGTGDKPSFSGTVDPMTGEVDGKFSNVPGHFRPTLVARVGINKNGIKGYREADLEGGGMRYAVAGGIKVDFDADDDQADGAVTANVDFMVKNAGLTASGGVFLGMAGAGIANQEYAAWGAHVQVGKMMGKKYQPAARFAIVDPDGDDNNVIELTGGVSLYNFGHGFKWQTDAGLMLVQAQDGPDFMARSQLQLSF